MPPVATPHETDLETLVLLGVRLVSVGEAPLVAERVGRPAPDVEAALARLGDKEWVRHRAGALPGWSLLPAGRAEGVRRLADELDHTGLRPLVADAHHRFLRLNQPLLGACTRWQLRDQGGRQVLNDHSDAAWDAAVVAELAAVDDAAQPLVGDLARALARFGSYGPRLTRARAHVESGDGDWFTKPTIDSYHTVWFELHEHLLASLGLERAAEES